MTRPPQTPTTPRRPPRRIPLRPLHHSRMTQPLTVPESTSYPVAQLPGSSPHRQSQRRHVGSCGNTPADIGKVSGTMPHMHPCKTKPGQQTYLVPKTAGRTTTSGITQAQASQLSAAAPLYQRHTGPHNRPKFPHLHNRPKFPHNRPTLRSAMPSAIFSAFPSQTTKDYGR
jgi:hypothetical protein